MVIQSIEKVWVGVVMYVYRGDLGNYVDALVDMSKPLLVTSAGNIRPRSAKEFFTTRPEGREDYQLLYVADGRIIFRFHGEEQVLDKGNMVLYWPGESQHYKMYSAEQAEFYWVHFTGYDVERLLAEWGIPHGRNVFWVGTDSDYRWLFYQMIRELQSRRAHYEQLLNMNLQHLFLLMHRHLTDTEDTATSFHGEVIQALTWFDRHWREDISIEEYATRNRMSPCWFRQKFKAFTGTSPMQHIINLRITNAMNLIENTDYNISQIAEAVGYDNPAYFRRLFRKHTGMSPLEYKKQKRK